MEDHELIAWIRKEITSTTVRAFEEVVDYEVHLEPNPEMHCSEFTSYPATRDRQYIYVEEPVWGSVLRTVLDEERASAAARALVGLVLEDERYICLAKELMGEHRLFIVHWEQLLLRGKEKKTRSVALRTLGRAPSQLFMKKVLKVLSHLKRPVQILWNCFVAVCMYGTIIYVFWPKSRLGLWIGKFVKDLIAESKRIVSG